MGTEPFSSDFAFGVLGPVTAWHEGRVVPLPGSKAKAALAFLVLNAGDVVTSRRLTDALWGPAPPASAPKMLQMIVSKLRRALPEPLAVRLETHPRGYRLDAPFDTLDLFVARALLDSGTSALPAHPDLAATTFRRALALWRGEPLSDVAAEPFAAAAIAELDEFRLALLDRRIAADLALGRHAELIGELRTYAALHPVREQAAMSLMLALYRSGRQVDALQTAREFRTGLAEEFGLDPSPELRQLEQHILRRDPGLDLPAASATAAGTEVLDSEGAVPVAVRAPRRRRMLLAVLVAAISIAAAAAVVLTRPSDKRATIGLVRHGIAPNSLVVLDALSGAVRADLHVGRSPGSAVRAGNSVWVCNRDDHTLTRVNASSFSTENVVGLTDFPQSLTTAQGQIWIALGYSGKVARIDAARDQLTAAFYPDKPVRGFLTLATSTAGVWIGTADAIVARLDAANAAVTGRVALPLRATALTATSSVAWSVSHDGAVYRLAAGAAPVRLATVPKPVVIAYGAESLWVATDPHRLVRLDARSGRVEHTYTLRGTPSALAIGSGFVWVGESPDGVVERFSAIDDAPRASYELGYPIGGLLVDGTSLWVSLDDR